MSQLLLTFHRSEFNPPREGPYYVWAGGIPKIARWDNRRWYDMSGGDAFKKVITNVTFWATIPGKGDLERADAPTLGENAPSEEAGDARG